jgi:Na+-translocating ferredoxin:NAD+ oxidoreductase subunit C
VPHDGLPQDLGWSSTTSPPRRGRARAVIEGRPLIERIVTVTGPGIARPRNLVALIGTPIAHLVEAAGGYSGRVSRLILGGPLSGTALANDDIPVTKGSNCVLALTDEQLAHAQPTMPCINCGECVRVCPASLLPQTLFRLIEADHLDEAADSTCSTASNAAAAPRSAPAISRWSTGTIGTARTNWLRRLDQRRAALAKRRSRGPRNTPGP